MLYDHIISTTKILSERLYLPWDVLENVTISWVTFLNINLGDFMKHSSYFSRVILNKHFSTRDIP